MTGLRSPPEFSDSFRDQYRTAFHVIPSWLHSPLVNWNETNIKLLDEFLDTHYRNDAAVHHAFEMLHHYKGEEYDGITSMLILLKFYAEDNLRLRKELLDRIMNSPAPSIIFPKGDFQP